MGLSASAGVARGDDGIRHARKLGGIIKVGAVVAKACLFGHVGGAVRQDARLHKEHHLAAFLGIVGAAHQVFDQWNGRQKGKPAFVVPVTVRDQTAETRCQGL